VQLHQRGKRIVLIQMVALGAASTGPILGGYLSQVYGWRIQFHILLPFTLVALILIVFACPEHAYVRDHNLDIDMNADTPNESTTTENKEESGETTTIVESRSSAGYEPTAEPRRSYWEELKPFNGLITRQNPLILLARPFACFLYPAVFWTFTVGGLWSAWVRTFSSPC
jgi:MFS family permease